MKNIPDFFSSTMRAMLLMITSLTAYAQQGPQFTQFMFNNLAINPAFAGADEALSMTAVSRTQWSGIEHAPVTTSFSAHGLVLDRVGLGLTVVDDRIGVHAITTVAGNYAYHIKAGRSSFISMGIQGGVTRFVSDYPSIAGNSNDPKLANYINQTRPDIGAGLYFRSPRLDAGLSALGLLTRRMAVSNTVSTKLQNADFLAYARYRMRLSETLTLAPAMLIKYFPGLLPSFDVNGSLIYRDVLTAGLSYRSNESVDLLFKLQVTTRMQFGYWYDHPLKSKNSLNRASHEFMLNYVFRKVHKNVHLTQMIAVKNILIVCLTICAISAMGQATVFNVMRKSSASADERFEKGDYAGAIELYNDVLAKEPGNRNALLRVARAHYNQKEYKKAVDAYQACMKRKAPFQWDDLYKYAEAQSVLGNYPVALEYYRMCQGDDPDNEMISKKIWRLTNFQYLYDDSANYAVRPLAVVNTTASEMCAVPFGKGFVFASNRKGERPLDQANGKITAQFYDLYRLDWNMNSPARPARRPEIFSKSLESPFNSGPVAFFNNETQMVFVASARKANTDGYRPLGLHFAKLKDGEWIFESTFALNDDNSSITDVTINEEGTVLFFSSDRKGGRGGKDIYKSTKMNGKWSGPWNVKEPVNTSGDESFPYLHRNGTLYFSSNGHPGMGGLDIFESSILADGFTEPENIGYPVNSSHDDFGLSFDTLATHGYFTSNRAKGGYNDDIYEFDITLQTYPFAISGVLRYREGTQDVTTEIHTWANARMALFDTWRDVKVEETVSDAKGKFKFSIPYHSRYHILITDENGVGHTASLELEKQRTEAGEHEIVVVKETFTGSKDGN